MERPAVFRQVENITGADPVAALSCSEALRRRGNSLLLFTPALLFTHGGFDRDPVIEFDARIPAESRDLRPFCIDVLKDHEFFFKGLGSRPAPGRQQTTNWDKRLYCIHESRKEECFGFLGGIAFSDPKRGLFAQSFSHDILIRDPTSRFNETLSVTVFGVRTNTRIFFMQTSARGLGAVRTVDTTLGLNAPAAIVAASRVSGFTGEDPLTMRDD